MNAAGGRAARRPAAGRRALVPWYVDLERGTGEAAALDPAIRAVLLRVTADAADAEGVRAEDAARAASDAFAAARKQEQADARARAKALDRHDPRRAFWILLRMLGISIPVLGLTPIVASFGTLVIPPLTQAVFVAAENDGRTSGDAPVVLYTHLAVTLLLSCAATFAINLIFGVRARFRWLVTLCGLAGFAAAATLLVRDGGAIWLWDLTPYAAVLGYLLSQAATTAADVLRTDRRV